MISLNLGPRIAVDQGMESKTPRQTLPKSFVGFLCLWTCVLNVGCGQATFQEVGPDAEDRAKPLLLEEEQFVQDRDTTAIDVLFVVDNSGSMADEHALVASKFSAFSSALSGLNWQIGLTTTDTNSNGARGSLLTLAGRSDRILTLRTPDYDRIFSNTIRRPESIECSLTGRLCPSGAERPLLASVLAMQKAVGSNASFFRPKTDLALVILTDEDEDQSGRPEDFALSQDVLAVFAGTFLRTHSLTAHSITVRPGDVACYNAQAAQASGTARYATAVNELVETTGGQAASICDSDYSSVLNKIGRSIREQVSSFQLRFKPSRNTTSVVIEPAQAITWRIEGNRLILSRVPDQGTRLKVRYSRRGE
jgi:hypothetical protein